MKSSCIVTIYWKKIGILFGKKILQMIKNLIILKRGSSVFKYLKFTKIILWTNALLKGKNRDEHAWWITLYNIIVMSYYYYCCIYIIYFAPTHSNIALYDIVLNINGAVRIYCDTCMPLWEWWGKAWLRVRVSRFTISRSGIVLYNVNNNYNNNNACLLSRWQTRFWHLCIL